ncbi:MAG: SGNH/GDSL hydrolase family protein [Saprospiraceae bacterium]|jgi:lysophospholipase L1-like esterase|nr:SGNH/GDSL hydrolase family protein [Saprospiraceae bacterium]
MERRQFIKNTALAAFFATELPLLVQAANPHKKLGQPIADNATILFQGDSITDAGRNREALKANDAWGLGNGYAYMIAASMLARNPDKQYQFYNRGVSGNKVFQLAERWDKDCLQLQPSLLSIMIGVNDFWHTLTHGYTGTVDTYVKDLRALLDRTKKALPDVQLVLGEPFYVKGGTAIDAETAVGLRPYQDALKAFADDYKAIIIPFQTIFNEALVGAPVEYWCPDGVHPSIAGNFMMAEAWMYTMGL